jgi:hypothetical protein
VSSRAIAVTTRFLGPCGRPGAGSGRTAATVPITRGRRRWGPVLLALAQVGPDAWAVLQGPGRLRRLHQLSAQVRVPVLVMWLRRVEPPLEYSLGTRP